MSETRISAPTFSFGPDYPAVLTDFDGTLMPLVRERRWSRVFQHPTTRTVLRIPRFMDGSATMSLEELRAGWPTWTPAERGDFCGSAPWLRDQGDFPEMLRFLMREGDSDERSGIALSVATMIGQEEAFQLLCSALDAAELFSSVNILQAIAETRHASAAGILRARFETVWALPELWEDAPFHNGFAFVAICSVKYLLELGADPAAFEPAVRALAEHRCAGSRKICRGYLHSHYAWLADDPK